MYIVTIKGNTAEQVRHELMALAGMLDGAQTTEPGESTPPVEAAPATEAQQEKAPWEEPHPVPIEQVRAKLAELMQAGKRTQVQSLFTELGVTKLSEVPAEKYGELLAAAEAV